jgi:hypothetical protein
MAQESGEFEFCLPEMSNRATLKFRTTQQYIHAVWSQEGKDKKGIYLSSSSDQGKNFTAPKKIIDTEGDVKETQIIAKDDYFVVTVLENVTGSLKLRAVTGIVNSDMTYQIKPCERVDIDGEIINAYTVFTEDASVDHIYVILEIIERDGRICFSLKRIEQIHCSRLVLRKS